MAKPILVIKHSILLNHEQHKLVVKNIKLQTDNEYHVLVAYDQNANGYEFSTYNAKDLVPIDIVKLKEIVDVKAKEQETKAEA